MSRLKAFGLWLLNKFRLILDLLVIHLIIPIFVLIASIELVFRIIVASLLWLSRGHNIKMAVKEAVYEFKEACEFKEMKEELILTWKRVFTNKQQ